MMKKIFVLLFILATAKSHSQKTYLQLSGKYGDGLTQLELRPDSSFTLSTTDPVYPYTYTRYQNEGDWTIDRNKVILNPGMPKLQPEVSMKESHKGHPDSITFKINYYTAIYEGGIFQKKEAADFDMLTLYINQRKNQHHLVHRIHNSSCAFSPRIRPQVLVDTSGCVRFPKQAVTEIGVLSWGFDHMIELPVSGRSTNYFEITVVQPLDKERMPRSKEVIIKGNQAYFYEQEGKVSRSIFTNTLRKIKMQ